MSNVILAVFPQLFFDGEAAAAIALYEKALGANVERIMRFSEMPGMDVAPERRDRVMHASLVIGGGRLLLADTMVNTTGPTPTLAAGHGTIHLEYESPEAMPTRFAALAEGGRIVVPLHDAFWGATYGQLVDRFGVGWAMHFDKSRVGNAKETPR
jgi:PhnB protein